MTSALIILLVAGIILYATLRKSSGGADRSADSDAVPEESDGFDPLRAACDEGYAWRWGVHDIYHGNTHGHD